MAKNILHPNDTTTNIPSFEMNTQNFFDLSFGMHAAMHLYNENQQFVFLSTSGLICRVIFDLVKSIQGQNFDKEQSLIDIMAILQTVLIRLDLKKETLKKEGINVNELVEVNENFLQKIEKLLEKIDG